MAHDVFISYSNPDKFAADAACATFEAAGIRCWIAPRDILPGAEWGEAIVEAIDHCPVMVLIFSSNANESRQVRREVERAVSKAVMIMPVRIEQIEPTRSLEYFMSGVHWLDALTPPLEHHLQRLAMSIKAFLQKAPRGPANNPASTSDSEPLDTRQSDLKEMLSAPMNLRDAIRWTGAASQDDIRLIDGLLFMSMASSYYWNSPEKFMVGLRRCLQNSKVLPEELAHKLLDDAEDAYKSFQYTIPESDTNGRWKQRNEHVDAICAVLGTHLPAKEECAGRILSLPVTTYLPALIAEYLKNEYYKSWLQSAPAKFIFDLITEEDHGKAPLYVLKMIISEVETDQDIHRRAVIAAKRLLGKDFDQWYVGIRGVTLSEDRKQREQAEARKEELRLRHAILEKGGVLPELGEHQTPLPVRPRRTWKFWKK